MIWTITLTSRTVYLKPDEELMIVKALRIEF